MKRAIHSFVVPLCCLGVVTGACRPKPTSVVTAPVTSVPPIATEVDPDGGISDNVTGAILETMNSGGYTYVKLATPQGEKWAAVPLTEVVVGNRFTVAGAHEMTGFASATLGRTFDRIYFGTAGGGYLQIARMHASPPAHSEEPLPPIAKAEGPVGYTVGELLRDRAALSGKRVAVRGQVVRYTPAVLGSNWIHLRDGTGGPRAEVTVTTTESARVGEIVVATGVLRIDRDFGAGTSYPALLDQAAVAR